MQNENERDNIQTENDLLKSENHILVQQLEDVKSVDVTTGSIFVEMNTGNQQPVEKANSLATTSTSLVNDFKINSQSNIDLHESLTIQIEQVKEDQTESQQAELKDKEVIEIEASVSPMPRLFFT